MSIKEVRDNILRVLWLENQATVPAYIWEDVTTAINSALQHIHQTPLDYFRKEEVDVVFNGVSEVDLFATHSAQELIGPVWLPTEDNRELQQVMDESEFNNLFDRYYGMSEADALAAGVPEASFYYIKTRRSYSENGNKDSSRCILAIKPVPSASITVRTLVSKAPASYTTSQIQTINDNEVTPIPADCVETILLPIARWYAMRSHFFFEKDKKDLFEQDALRAMSAINVTDPAMGTDSKMAERLKRDSSKITQPQQK